MWEDYTAVFKFNGKKNSGRMTKNPLKIVTNGVNVCWVTTEQYKCARHCHNYLSCTVKVTKNPQNNEELSRKQSFEVNFPISRCLSSKNFDVHFWAKSFRSNICAFLHSETAFTKQNYFFSWWLSVISTNIKYCSTYDTLDLQE